MSSEGTKYTHQKTDTGRSAPTWHHDRDTAFMPVRQTTQKTHAHPYPRHGHFFAISHLGPDAEAAHVPAWRKGEQVEAVDASRLHAGEVAEGAVDALQCHHIASRQVARWIGLGGGGSKHTMSETHGAGVTTKWADSVLNHYVLRVMARGGRRETPDFTHTAMCCE